MQNSNPDYISQRDAIFSVFQTYGVANVAGLTVGNEYMLEYVHKYSWVLGAHEFSVCSYLTDNGGTDPNSAIGDQGSLI